IIRDVWLKPATPNKIKKKKNKGEVKLTNKRRIMQGEKGIGRFAVQKLGDKISVYSKKLNGVEAELKINFTDYDQDQQLDLFKDDNEQFQYKFLDEVKNEWAENDIPKVIKKPKGTLIRIKNLRETWTKKDLSSLFKSFQNLVTPTIPDNDIKLLKLNYQPVKDFDIKILIDGVDYQKKETAITFS